MMEANHTATVQILDKLYYVKCPKEKIQDLEQAAIYLDEKMRELSKSSTLLDLERSVVMVALNLAYEVLSLKRKEVQFYDNMGNRLQSIQKKIEASLSAHQEELQL